MEAVDTGLVFEWLGPLRLLAVVGFVALAGWLSWQGLADGMSRGRRVVLMTLRLLSTGLVALLILGPALEHRQLESRQSRVAVVVDASQSMQINDDGKTRAQRVVEFLAAQSAQLQKINSAHGLLSFQFAEQLTEVSAGELGRSSAGKRTDLRTAISALAELSGEGDLVAAFLISDGADTAHLSHGMTGADLAPDFAELLASLSFPISTLAVGTHAPFVDLAIAEVASDDFAFVRNAVELEVTVSATGLGKLSIPVSLEQGGRSLTTTMVHLTGSGVAKASLRFVPDEVGNFAYQVKVPILDGEALTDNNQHSFVTRIIRDKMRILHVVGRPSWDQRFLREVFERDPNLDLVSFYILRSTVDAPGVGEQELSLIPFPVRQLFGSELNTFDAVIFQNFNHAPYDVGYYLPQIADYVRGGGAFCMIGGDLSFGAGGYGHSPIEQILPIQLELGSDWHKEEVRAVLTEAGIRHPITDFGGGNPFEQLPPLDSFNLAMRVDPAATVLLAHPFERIGRGRAPLVAIREVGRGRSAAVLTDGTWRWRFRAGAGEGSRPYQRFWSNMLRWLIRDPAMRSVSLRMSQARFGPGEKVSVHLRQRGVEMSGPMRVDLLRTPGEEQVASQSVLLAEDGTATVEFAAPGSGAYLAKLVADGDPGSPSAAEPFVVEGGNIEFGQPAPRPDLLAAIAEKTGGVFASLGEANLIDLPLDGKVRSRVVASTTRPLLEKIWFLMLLLALLAAEWWIRRRWGFS